MRFCIDESLEPSRAFWHLSEVIVLTHTQFCGLGVDAGQRRSRGEAYDDVLLSNCPLAAGQRRVSSSR